MGFNILQKHIINVTVLTTAEMNAHCALKNTSHSQRGKCCQGEALSGDSTGWGRFPLLHALQRKLKQARNTKHDSRETQHRNRMHGQKMIMDSNRYT